ncbi:calcineurin-binding protein cabin-1 [Marchantia polymorpha subsp. ruderalis]|uniref:Uncharacterized protein n=1 Tax=Marchantia polymorpha TaxID=3197 RepID=A0A2R6XDE9_MARPO|nr:hypothetical protein MARPO_0021s0014 [Marchantia polymorpha]BBN01208.1 hypothetical protein Mp_2g05580 [Marchantia polymorpha subsp. ruderalis]|eukprot:PTQ44132.1 hypothetical protein MARPO_0021s0014 [Marchantia polymorpha]
MFSIAAINDTSSPRPRLETLPPTKEAQEARLAQTYQEALTELQAGNLTKAQSLFQSILQDPIILQTRTSKKENVTESIDSNPMLQLRFSTLKNLAETLFKQDFNYHNDALDCYLQAASIDQDDVVLWNRLGTLACALGHLDIARAAFEQGLLCSPRNWLCMEKLAEVLIAIGDEEACRYTVKRLLKLSPSHTRARHIDDVLEGRADAREILRKRDYFNECLFKLNVLPRGLDLLEPRHFSLSFPKKRQLEDEDEGQGSSKRSKIQTVDVRLSELSWRSLLSSMIDLLQSIAGSTGVKAAEPTSDEHSKSRKSGSSFTDGSLVNALVVFSVLRKRLTKKPTLTGNGASASTPEKSPGLERRSPYPFPLSGPGSSGESRDQFFSKAAGIPQDGHRTRELGVACVSLSSNHIHPADIIDSLKVAEALYEDELPSQERRSTRIERIRTRGYDKDDKLCSAKSKEPDQCEVLRQQLEPFIARIDMKEENLQLDVKLGSECSSDMAVDGGGGGSLNTGRSSINAPVGGEQREEQDALAEEENDVQQFLEDHKVNSGPYHVAHKLLETLALNRCRQEITVSKVLLLETLIRHFSWTTRSRACSLYLAELSLDMFSTSSQRNASLFLTECDFHLCRVVEAAGLHAACKTLEVDMTTEKEGQLEDGKSKESSIQDLSASKNDTQMIDAVEWNKVIREGHPTSKEHDSEIKVETPEVRHNVEIINQCQDTDWRLWLRYHWLNGRWHMHSGRREKAHEELNTCLALMESRKRRGEFWLAAMLPHCKVDNVVNPVTVQRMLYELDIDKLLKESACTMVEKSQYSELIDLLVPVLLPSKDSEKGKLGWNETRKGAVDSSPEFNGLSILISACEKVDSPNLSLALQCYARRLEILCGAMGLGKKNGRRIAPGFSRHTMSPVSSDSEQEQGKGNEVQRKLVAVEVKLVSRCVASIRDKVDEAGGKGNVTLQSSVLRQVQELLLDIICYDLKNFDLRETVGLNISNVAPQFDSSSFVDNFVAFCRLQHLDINASIKEQVDLLAAVHDVLAARGLCCAGKTCEGGEGAFLKLAIKHLGSIELKLRLIVAQKGSVVAANDASKETSSHGTEGDEKEDAETSPEPILENKEDSREEPFNSDTGKGKRKKAVKSAKDEEAEEIERRRVEIGLDSVLDQCFFCLYGLNLRGGFEPSSHDGLSEHQNTNRGDYKTKEQCAGVFQYILPYAKACTRARLLKLRKVLRAVHKQFPYPPAKFRDEKAVEGFLDDPEFEEENFSDMVLSGRCPSQIVDFALNLHLGAPDVEEDRVSEQSKGNAAKQTETGKVNLLESGDAMDTGMHAETSVTMAVSDSSKRQTNEASLPDVHPNREEPYLEVYENLYHFVSEIEDISASDKWAGFVLTKEGEEFVEQNAKLLKYDLCYNPLRFESWNKLAKIYDEEVDLMLNDGSKNVNAVEWRKNNHLTTRVEMSRRRTRRCLLMTLALAKTPEQQSEVHELLALVYYDSLQNVAPSYDQRSYIPKRDASWISLCNKAMKHFEGAYKFKSDWKHLFYMGKLCEKLGRPCDEALGYYKQAVDMKSSAVDPVYRLHASRLKLLCEGDREEIKVLQVIAEHCYVASTKEKVCSLLDRVVEGTSDKKSCSQNASTPALENGNGHEEANDLPVDDGLADPADPADRKELIVEIRRQLFEDCITVMRVCVEGELKHFHKARFRLAHGLYTYEIQDMDKAKEELAFCFRSSRSMFTINMWEIDGSLRKIRRKAAHATNLDVQMPESSRKFITCVRKYLILYLSLCEQNGDIYTLERAFSSLKADKKFSLCLDDLSRLALRKYTQALSKQIGQAETNPNGSVTNTGSNTLMEKLFNLFMDHGTSWSESLESTLAEAQTPSTPQVSEGSIHRHIHRYLYNLEREMKLDILEAMNERIRKRFKSIKMLGFRTGEICRHACLAWCRALCFSLASITPLNPSKQVSYQLQSQGELVVDIQQDIFMSSSYELPASGEGSREEGSEPGERISRGDAVDGLCGTVSIISLMKHIPIRQASVENLEKATSLLRSTYGFYRDSLSGPFPGGINLYLVQVSNTSGEGSSNGAGTTTHSKPVDISCPRKLLLWAFTLVHGRTGSVAEAVKYCEEQAKPRLKRAPVSGVLHTSPSAVLINSHG